MNNNKYDSDKDLALNQSQDANAERYFPTQKERISATLSAFECNVLRGLAIIGIFLHNYCHWLNPVVKENEYTFKVSNVEWFRQVVIHPDILFPLQWISFFGHYGVPIFLFLSAYGLFKKYGKADERKENKWSASVFIAEHYLKLFRMMVIGFVLFIVVDAQTPGSWNYTWEKVVAQLLMYNNLFERPDRMIWPGPYWFFGLMLQLYIVYRLVLHKRHVAFTILLMVICVALQLTFDAESNALNRYRYNFMGGMLPFGLGLLYARYEHFLQLEKNKTTTLFVRFLIASMLVVCLSVSFFWWTFVPVAVCATAIWGVKWFVRMPWASVFLKLLHWVGVISASLFVTHPIARKVIIPISRQGDTYTGLFIYIFGAIFLAWLFHVLMQKIPEFRIKKSKED